MTERQQRRTQEQRAKGTSFQFKGRVNGCNWLSELIQPEKRECGQVLLF